MAHGMSADLLRRSVHEAEMKPSEFVRTDVDTGANAQQPKTVFVPVSLPAPAPTPPAEAQAQAPDIRIELRRGPTTIAVILSGGAANDCALWMREVLR